MEAAPKPLNAESNEEESQDEMRALRLDIARQRLRRKLLRQGADVIPFPGRD